jgi:hypothetical protein
VSRMCIETVCKVLEKGRKEVDVVGDGCVVEPKAVQEEDKYRQRERAGSGPNSKRT